MLYPAELRDRIAARKLPDGRMPSHITPHDPTSAGGRRERNEPGRANGRAAASTPRKLTTSASGGSANSGSGARPAPTSNGGRWWTSDAGRHRGLPASR